MSEKIFHLRRFYFSFLYGSFIYIAALLLILKDKKSNIVPSVQEELIIGLTGIIPASIFYLRKTGYIFKLQTYLFLLLISQIPLIIGTILSLIKKSYVYFFISYPIFLITVMILLPTKKGVNKKND